MADNFDSFPNVTDDDGSLTTGTPFSNAYNALLKATIADQVYSSTNPTIKPKATTDEVVAARGSKSDLDARLDVALEENGTPKAVAGQATESQVITSIGPGNWLQNDVFLIWDGGDAVAPTGFVLTGSGAAVARAGVGLGDTRHKVGPFCAKVTRAAADTYLYQNVMNSTSFATYGEFFQGRTFSFGAWVWASTANQARVEVYDGVTVTQSSMHTGDSTWQFLGGLHTVSGTATLLRARLGLYNSSGDVWVSGISLLPGVIELEGWVPCRKIYGAIVLKSGGDQTVEDGKDHFIPARPMLVKDVMLFAATAPTSADLIIDLEKYDGRVAGTWSTMFSTLPQIDAGDKIGGLHTPDGTYKERCFPGNVLAATLDSVLRCNVDQIGSGAPGSNLSVIVRVMQYVRPQEDFLHFADGVG